jgi:Family of unknown function (DUF5996)
MNAPELWPAFTYDEMAPMVQYVRRLSQIAGKYSLSLPYEPLWGNVTLLVTARGFTSRTLWAGDLAFNVEYALLDDEVIVRAASGSVSVPLAAESVAAFYERFVQAVAPLGIPAPRTTIESEIPGGTFLDRDVEPRSYDPLIARRIWAALASASRALNAYQSSYRGPRPEVGIMWGGFDLYAPRHTTRSVTPPASRPIFQQNGMNAETVAVGFSFGEEPSRTAGFYAYIAPPPVGIEKADLGVAGAAYNVAAGLAVLPWDVVRSSSDPHATVLRFGDAVYAAAVKLGGWPADWAGERHDGWYASRHLVP